MITIAQRQFANALLRWPITTLAWAFCACAGSADDSGTVDLASGQQPLAEPPIGRLPELPNEDSIPIPTSSCTPSCGTAEDQCLGVIGLACQGIGLPNGVVGGCLGDSCWINAGSWEHDECCMRNPQGLGCGLERLTEGEGCEESWNKAIALTLAGLSWRRELDRCRHSRTVDFSAYCAPGGTELEAIDVNKCCSGRAVRIGPLAICDGPGVVPTQRTECRSAPTPLPRPRCTSDSQCGPDDRCLQQGPQKVCTPWR